MKKIFKILAVSAAFLIATPFISCKKEKAVYEIPATEEETKKMEEYTATANRVSYGVEITSEGKTVVYTYIMPEITKDSGEQIAKGLNSYKDSMREAVNAIESETGVKGVSLKYVYKNKKGEVCATYFYHN